jgi:hypothetical protein
MHGKSTESLFIRKTCGIILNVSEFVSRHRRDWNYRRHQRFVFLASHLPSTCPLVPWMAGGSRGGRAEWSLSSRRKSCQSLYGILYSHGFADHLCKGPDPGPLFLMRSPPQIWKTATCGCHNGPCISSFKNILYPFIGHAAKIGYLLNLQAPDSFQ